MNMNKQAKTYTLKDLSEICNCSKNCIKKHLTDNKHKTVSDTVNGKQLFKYNLTNRDIELIKASITENKKNRNIDNTKTVSDNVNSVSDTVSDINYKDMYITALQDINKIKDEKIEVLDQYWKVQNELNNLKRLTDNKGDREALHLQEINSLKEANKRLLEENENIVNLKKRNKELINQNKHTKFYMALAITFIALFCLSILYLFFNVQ